MVATQRIIKLKRIFFIFLALYIVNLVIPQVGPYSHTQRLWLVVNVIISLLSLLILAREKLPALGHVMLGVCFGILVGVSSPMAGITTFLAFVAARRLFDQTDQGISVLKSPIRLTLLLGGGIGFFLGIINLALAGGQELVFAPSFYAFLVSLNPGISEEIIYRFFIYAFAIRVLGGQIKTHQETIWVYVLMIVPHVLMHFPDSYFVNGVFHLDLGNLVIGPVILIALFGLPMTLLLVKRDLTAAMITHTLVDFIRFIFVGLPF